ncbi:isoquinoline 1-oxidoreductase beta subunit [Inhella inkyongensis]|uniref:Isoquinoline 1-oxidoreductase beta subunit n=1 Tax=Inhella inkyongensis TaxID=392593 RepID=A0A840S9L1_9BURK|nr:molybdopterin cofactor-binding domain-containing protein [Inhella inkyongensis]MBB5206218.1 isoquinoline 1-oxidoreductase beta subunit [Inhella inkyongensis]
MKRRHWLVMGLTAAGALGVGVGLRPPSARSRLGPPRTEGPRVALNAWVELDADGLVSVRVPRAEMGQGVHTAFAQLVAEELEADWASLRVLDAPIAPLYANSALLLNMLPLQPDDQGPVALWVRGAAQRMGQVLGLQITGGSSSVRDAWEPLRLAGAAARQALLQAAAQQWGVDVSSLRTAQGRVWAGERSLGYGELAASAATQTLPAEITLKNRRDWRLIGRSPPRLDLPAKVKGQAVYGIDVRLPGLLHAAIRQAPVAGGSVVALDVAALKARRGVVDAFVLGESAAVVVADNWWRAEAALKAHPPRFHAGPGAGRQSAEMSETLRRALDQHEGTGFREDGDALAVLAQADRVLRADYALPFLAHAAMEPLNCTAQVREGRVEVWCPTQVASLARWKAAEAAGVAQEAVTVHTTYLGGGFGRRLETEVIEQAVAIALRLNGAPVRLLWSREQDFTHDVYRPMALARFEACLGPDGLPLAWVNKVAGPSVSFGSVQRLAPGLAMDLPDKNHIEGAFELPYAIPNLRVRQIRRELGVAVGSWRSVGHSLNAFFTECFLDELAQAAGQDPLRYREQLLAHRPRHLAVLKLAAAQAGWGQTPAAGRARGLALHESFGSICAQVVEASLEPDGRPRVHRVVCALDCGTVLHPDTVRAQIEGSVVFALTAALYGEITLVDGAVQQQNFPQQPLLSLAETPQIDVHLMPSEAAPGGVGEPGVPPLTPALANAMFGLTGRRIRSLPIR